MIMNIILAILTLLFFTFGVINIYRARSEYPTYCDDEQLEQAAGHAVWFQMYFGLGLIVIAFILSVIIFVL